jgi:hypothetical protein
VKKLAPGLPADHPEVIAARLEELERKMERLRSMYEVYFTGADRRPPNTPRQEMNRLVLETQQIKIRNAGLRFRFQSMMQKWTLFTTYWNRTLREIEAGTYRKDLAKTQRRLARRGDPLTEAEAVSLGVPATRAKAFIERQNRNLGLEGKASDKNEPPPQDKPAAVARPAEPPVAPPRLAPALPGMTSAELAELHRRYDGATRRLNPSGTGVALDKLQDMLAQRIPKILQEHQATRVTFDVAVKDGRVVLRAKPIK